MPRPPRGRELKGVSCVYREGAKGPKDPRTQGPKDPRTQGPKGPRRQGPKGARTQGPKERSTQGPRTRKRRGAFCPEKRARAPVRLTVRDKWFLDAFGRARWCAGGWSVPLSNYDVPYVHGAFNVEVHSDDV